VFDPSHSKAPAAADVAVIGAGVIGLSIAWRACRRGLRVIVLERATAGAGASNVAAGMLAPIAEVIAAEQPLLELGLASAREYPRFVSELCDEAGLADVGYTRCGTLLVARDADEAEALEREFELRQRFGLNVERLRPSQARTLEPGLAPALRLALDVSDDHAIDPRVLIPALCVAIERAGGEVRPRTPVAGLATGGGRVSGVIFEDGSQLAASAIVIAAGSWADQLQGIAAHVPVSPIKGQIMRLHDPAGPGLLTRVIRMGSSYVVPRGDGRYVLGATSEERGFDTTVTAGAGFELLRDATELVPGVSELILDEFSAGLRPATPDNLPAIGRGGLGGLHWAVGHRRGGILLAPVTAEMVCKSLLGEDLGPSAAAFAPGRFEHATAESLA
jgi:glycine oxidase